MSKVALVIAQQGFRDEEYFEPKKILEENGILVTTVSQIKGTAIGKLGGSAQADISINDFDASGYDGIFFIGGPGASVYFDNKKAHEILRTAFGLGKLIGAICAGPAVLASAGLLKNKKATSFSGVYNYLIKGGAILTKTAVEVDGKIITADGPANAAKFGLEIVKALNG
ncbi:MAG: DJ-1/PfpI family protein [Candidatus Margulisiibacteriota bacterium]